ncbi:recombinase family protein [Arthrobacter sp. YA7-1]|uniref:recombinase family protein n=1 Tax=Arthrobacter sp. YA7-1 TaxID=2987701 RepID=UPI00222616B3|nr:recombinase family protein [Arthrobacter sp. YA7-1]UYY80389.1 recombinase family protein [Arthrobacter sp. YA7-1]
MKAKTNAVIYTRQSVHREESISHELQIQACTAYAKSKDYEILRVETDPGISGLNLTKRKALARSLASIKKGDAEVLIVWRWSRLSRARQHQALLLSEVEESGGRVESALEPMDTSAAGKFGRDVLLAMAAFESEQKSETWRQAHERRAENKLPPLGHAKFGYMKTEEGYVPDPVTASLVKEGYRMYSSNIGFKKIAAFWTESGTKTMRGNHWDKDMVRKTMDNAFYVGKFAYKGELKDGKHESLLSIGEWATYQAKRKERAKLAPRTKASEWAFAGYVHCSRCGGAMVKNVSGKNVYLHCSRRRKGNGCEGVTGIMSQVNLSIWSWFGSHREEWAASMPSDDEAIIAADLAVVNAQAAKDAAQDRIEGLITRAVRFDLPDSEISGPLAEFRKELTEATEQLETAFAIQASYVPTRDVWETITRGTQDMSVEEWRGAVGKVLAGVLVLPNRKVLVVPRGESAKVW